MGCRRRSARPPTRALDFVRRHGRLVQVELEALDPDTLRNLYADAFHEFYDTSRFESICQQEEAQRVILRDALARLNGEQR